MLFNLLAAGLPGPREARSLTARPGTALGPSAVPSLVACPWKVAASPGAPPGRLQPFNALSLGRAELQAAWEASAVAHGCTEVSDVLWSPEDQSRPGRYCPPPRGHAAGPEPHRRIRREFARAPCRHP